MNEFLQQFVVESRELVSQAMEGLLKLEQAPGDAEVLDAVFRAFHTLKGGAGIVEFPAMERAVHAAEELLAETRLGQREITSALVSSCLASLDQIGRWLEVIARSGSLPQGDAEADAIVRQFEKFDGKGGAKTAASDSSRRMDRVTAFASSSARDPDYGDSLPPPSVDCFFQGRGSRSARRAGVPQLMAQVLTPICAWPSLSELDPYACKPSS